jgi:hypothetical protein
MYIINYIIVDYLILSCMELEVNESISTYSSSLSTFMLMPLLTNSYPSIPIPLHLYAAHTIFVCRYSVTGFRITQNRENREDGIRKMIEKEGVFPILAHMQ